MKVVVDELPFPNHRLDNCSSSSAAAAAAVGCIYSNCSYYSAPSEKAAAATTTKEEEEEEGYRRDSASRFTVHTVKEQQILNTVDESMNMSEQSELYSECGWSPSVTADKYHQQQQAASSSTVYINPFEAPYTFSFSSCTISRQGKEITSSSSSSSSS